MPHMDTRNAYLWFGFGSELNRASADAPHDYVVPIDPKTGPILSFNPGFWDDAWAEVYPWLACLKHFH